MKNKFKVMYVVVTHQEEKVIYAQTETIAYKELKEIGEKMLMLIKKYPNTNVLFKVLV